VTLDPSIEGRVAAQVAAASNDRPAWLPPGEHFVVIVEDDTGRPIRYEWDALGIPRLAPECETGYAGRSITFEHYLGQNTQLHEIKAHAAYLRGRYGRVAVAKLVIVEADK